MKKLISSLAFLAFMPLAQAERAESPVTVQIKLYLQGEQVVNGPTASGSYSIASFKTADLIRRIGESKNKTYTKAARLLYISDFDGLLITTRYVIREKGQADDDVSTMIQLGYAADLNNGSQNFVVKYKRTTKDLIVTGSQTERATGVLVLRFPNTRELLMNGSYQSSLRHLASKQFPGTGYTTTTFGLMGGIGTFDLRPGTPERQSRYCEGSLKIGPAKITHLIIE